MWPNRALALVLAVTLSALALALWVPWLNEIFSFAPLAWPRLAEAAGAALAATIVNDLVGIIWRRFVSKTRVQPPGAREKSSSDVSKAAPSYQGPPR